MTHPSDRWRLQPDVASTSLVRSPTKTGPAVHRLSREQTAAWNDAEGERREEARTAIRDAVREQGGGELRDAKGKVLEVAVERTR